MLGHPSLSKAALGLIEKYYTLGNAFVTSSWPPTLTQGSRAMRGAFESNVVWSNVGAFTILTPSQESTRTGVRIPRTHVSSQESGLRLSDSGNKNTN